LFFSHVFPEYVFRLDSDLCPVTLIICLLGTWASLQDVHCCGPTGVISDYKLQHFPKTVNSSIFWFLETNY
jgi:hypothetical protein